MRTHNVCKIVFAAALLLICGAAFAQKEDNTSREVWKKKVGRVIDMAPKEDNGIHRHKDAKKDTSILEMMVNAIKKGKLIAYSNFDDEFTTRLSRQGLQEMTEGKTDTIEVTDPITNQVMVKVTHRDFDGSSIHKYRILEEWSFNPHTGKTEIQITGIAPIREIYDENNEFRGVQAMFWVKYSDVHSLIERYDELHHGKSFENYIWSDYFLNGNGSGDVLKGKAIRLIDLSQKDDNVIHHLVDTRDDSAMYPLIVAGIKSGSLIVYSGDDYKMATKVSYETLLEKSFGKGDTIIVTDPVTNQQTMKINNPNFQYFTINKYKLLEEWLFDAKTGRTTINLKAIGPFIEKNNENPESLNDQPLFWISFKDLHNVITSYEQYHPDNTIAGHIWADYFLSDVRPEAVK